MVTMSSPKLSANLSTQVSKKGLIIWSVSTRVHNSWTCFLSGGGARYGLGRGLVHMYHLTRRPGPCLVSAECELRCGLHATDTYFWSLVFAPGSGHGGAAVLLLGFAISWCSRAGFQRLSCLHDPLLILIICTWVGSWRCGCPVAWFCYQLM